MNKSNLFNDALKQILKWEGGYVNNPNDNGHATNKGITQHTYDVYRKKKKLPSKSVKYITQGEVNEIYFQNYWKACKCDTMSPAMAIVVFDTAVNMGTGKPQEYFKELGYNCTVEQFISRREKSYHNFVAHDKTQQVFLKGWLNRLNDLKIFIKHYQ